MSSNGLAAVGSTKPITNEAERVLTERRDRLKAQLDGDRCQQKLAEDNAAMHKKNGDENEKKYKEVCRALGKITK